MSTELKRAAICMATGTFKPSGPAAPVGVFDSGLGGLSVLRELVGLLPHEDFIYVADSGHCPYGGQGPEAIIARACQITEFLLDQGAKLIVVACNAATVAAVEYLRASYPLPFVGMEPAIKPAAALTKSGVVGVLTTALTARGERLQRLIHQHADGVQVLTQPCPGLVECVETGDLQGPNVRSMVTGYVEPLVGAGADTLVLGCTHYPFLRPLIQAVAGPQVHLLDTGAAVARRTRDLLEREGLVRHQGQGRVDWYTSGQPQIMNDVGSRLWGDGLQCRRLPG